MLAFSHVGFTLLQIRNVSSTVCYLDHDKLRHQRIQDCAADPFVCGAEEEKYEARMSVAQILELFLR
jgi:hypothetical protein